MYIFLVIQSYLAMPSYSIYFLAARIKLGS